MSELESKQALPRSEIAEYLHEFANELETAASGSAASDGGAESTDQRTDADASSGAESSDAIGTTKQTQSSTSPDEPAGTSTADVDDVDADESASRTDETASQTDDETASSTVDDKVTFVVGDESATIKPPDTPVFEIEVDSDSSLVGSAEQQSVSFELEWEVEDVDDDSRIEIK